MLRIVPLVPRTAFRAQCRANHLLLTRQHRRGELRAGAPRALGASCGTPNRKALRFDPKIRDFFALGGMLIKEEDEAGARKLHADFCRRWSINYPLHSVEIRHSTGSFTWLKRDDVECRKFMADLTRTLLSMNVLGIACTIDRPGYDARYREKYGRRQWHLCQTAFAVAVERAAKLARCNRRKLRILPERSNRRDEQRLLHYYNGLRTSGPPFDKGTSSPYQPLSADEFAQTLHEIRFKSKSSPMGQVADLFLWPIATARYQTNRAYEALRRAGRLIESTLAEKDWGTCGSKYSCFELVENHKR